MFKILKINQLKMMIQKNNHKKIMEKKLIKKIINFEIFNYKKLHL